MTDTIQYLRKNMLLPLIFGTIFIIAFAIEPIDSILEGFINILISPSILVSDYLLIGGLSATLINVSLTVLLNLYLVRM
ncbi:MAG: DUF1576 domain-containing protein, partial [Tenericutes bacterium HGW-Tenericutes-3]